MTHAASSSSQVATAFAFLGTTTALAGDITSVKAAIDRKQSNAPTDSNVLTKAQQVSANNDFWFVTLVPLSNFSGAIPDSNLSGAMQGNLLAAINQASGGIRFGDTVTISAEAVTRSEKDAQALVDVVKFFAGLVQLNRQNNPAAGQVATLLDTLQTSTTGNTTTISLAIPEQQLEQLLNSAHGRRPDKASLRMNCRSTEASAPRGSRQSERSRTPACPFRSGTVSMMCFSKPAARATGRSFRLAPGPLLECGVWPIQTSSARRLMNQLAIGFGDSRREKRSDRQIEAGAGCGAARPADSEFPSRPRPDARALDAAGFVGEAEDGVAPTLGRPIGGQLIEVLVGQQQIIHSQEQNRGRQQDRAGVLPLQRPPCRRLHERHRQEPLRQRPQQNHVMRAQSRVLGDRHLQPGHRHGDQAEHSVLRASV